jgi:hypothetical protein
LQLAETFPNRRGSARVIEADMIQRFPKDRFTWLNLVDTTMPPRNPNNDDDDEEEEDDEEEDREPAVIREPDEDE